MNHSFANLCAAARAAHHARRCTPHKARGSVLVFCLVILSLLAMVGMTFLLTMRQSGQAALNALGPIQADLAAQAGLNHATQALHQMVSAQSIVARDATSTANDGVFSPNPLSNPPYRYTIQNYADWESGHNSSAPPAPCAYWQFLGGTGPADSALLSVDPSDVALKSELLYTNAPLRVSTQANARFFIDDPLQPMLDRAFRWEMQGATNDFYNHPKQSTVKELPRVGSVRGCYHVWIEDLDAKLNVIPLTWGIDTTNLPQPLATTTALTVQNGIIGYLNGFLSNQPINKSMGGYAYLQTQDVNYMIQNQPQQPYVTMGDFFLNLNTLNTYADVTPPNSVGYEDLSTTLDYYFKTGRLNDAPGTPFSGTFNINTAPEEVIEAALSQIPAYDSLHPQSPNPALTFGTKMDAMSNSLAHRLATRIVAKRPFLCRMDFEDFAAAHLPGVITNRNTPLGAIHYAIPFRSDPSHPNGTIELTPNQYLEIPGCFISPTAFMAYAWFLNPGIPNPNTGLAADQRSMLGRFEFFADCGGNSPPCSLGKP